MPSSTEKQRKFMGAELARKRAGKKTETGMSEGKLEDFARKSLDSKIKKADYESEPRFRDRLSNNLSSPPRKIQQFDTKLGASKCDRCSPHRGDNTGRVPSHDSWKEHRNSQYRPLEKSELNGKIDNFISDRRITKTMAKNDISKSTGAKTRTTLKTSTKLPKPKKMTMQNPGTAKNKKPPVKRMNIKKQIDVQKILPAVAAAGGKAALSGSTKRIGRAALISAAANPKGFGEGIKAAGEGIKSASEGISNLRPAKKAIGMPGGGVPSVAPVAPMKTVPSMDKGLGSDYVKMPEPLNVMIRKAFTVLVPAIQKEMKKDLSKSKPIKKGTGGIIGTGLGGAAGAALGGPLGAGLGAVTGGVLGDSLGGGKSKGNRTKKINPTREIDVKKNPKVKKGTGGIVGTGAGGAIGAALGGPLGAGLGAVTGWALGESVGKSKDYLKARKVKKAGTGEIVGTGLGGAIGGAVGGPVGAGLGAVTGGALGGSMGKKPKVAAPAEPVAEEGDDTDDIANSYRVQKSSPKGGQYYTAPKKTKVSAPKRGGKYVSKADNVEKGWKQTAGMLGGAALGSAFGPIGAGAGAYAGKKLGDHLEKPKMAPKTATKARAPRAKTVSATRMMTTKNPRAKVVKSVIVKKGFLTEDNSVLTSTTKKIIRDSKDYHEEINDVLTKKQPDMERSELDMAKSQASLRVAKAIFYLKGYEPMDDSSVKKMFHGQIPEIMKSTEARPPQDWMEKAIKKSSGFAEDPIKYSMELWYDISKAVAEPIDSKMSPKKKGEDEQISDGTRVDTSDLVGKGKSESTETL